MDIRATVLIDNTAPDTLLAEWGLSIYIEYRGHKMLLDTEKGLVVFNSCCHGGADIVVEEAREALGKDVYALVGGLHLFLSDDDYVMEMAEKLRNTGIKRIITDHCTGERGLRLLKNELADIVEEMSSGYVFEI